MGKREKELERRVEALEARLDGASAPGCDGVDGEPDAHLPIGVVESVARLLDARADERAIADSKLPPFAWSGLSGNDAGSWRRAARLVWLLNANETRGASSASPGERVSR